jgi:hypothetical protein
MSVFALQDGAVYHTYSTYARGTEAFMGVYRFLDLAPGAGTRTGLSRGGVATTSTTSMAATSSLAPLGSTSAPARPGYPSHLGKRARLWIDSQE